MPISTAACPGMSVIIIVMTEYVLRGDDQVEPDSKITGHLLFAWLSVDDGLFGRINAGLCS